MLLLRYSWQLPDEDAVHKHLLPALSSDHHHLPRGKDGHARALQRVRQVASSTLPPLLLSVHVNVDCAAGLVVLVASNGQDVGGSGHNSCVVHWRYRDVVPVGSGGILLIGVGLVWFGGQGAACWLQDLGEVSVQWPSPLLVVHVAQHVAEVAHHGCGHGSAQAWQVARNRPGSGLAVEHLDGGAGVRVLVPDLPHSPAASSNGCVGGEDGEREPSSGHRGQDFLPLLLVLVQLEDLASDPTVVPSSDGEQRALEVAKSEQDHLSLGQGGPSPTGNVIGKHIQEVVPGLGDSAPSVHHVLGGHHLGLQHFCRHLLGLLPGDHGLGSLL